MAPVPVSGTKGAAHAAATMRKIEEAVLDLRHDPYGFVMFAFPWGEAGTLADQTGPYGWQVEILREIGAKLRAGVSNIGDLIQRLAVVSGHGIGKTALVAWVLLWALCTLPRSRLVLTANTEQQLRTKTWPEVSKWFGLLICRDWFTLTETAITSRDPEAEKTWRLDRVTWSETNVEAFQGLHNAGRRIVLVFDEASAIADAVWAASEGALTDANTEIIWLVLGNPTKNTGRFRECFGNQRHRWSCRQIDSRTVPGTNLKLFDQWARDYGDDSDFFRIRVKGEFPRAGSSQFIGGDVVDEAVRRAVPPAGRDALVLGVDIARHGDDQTVIYPRRGRDARSLAPIKLRVPDLMQVAGRVAALQAELAADAVFVDQGGMGVGVLDRLRQLGTPGVFGVEFGEKPMGVALYSEGAAYANRRAEMWGEMRAWLKHGAVIDDTELKADLVGPEYGYNDRSEIQLERKKDMKRRGLASPDVADALALTFAQQVVPRGQMLAAGAGTVAVDYDPFAEGSTLVRHGAPPVGSLPSSHDALLKHWGGR